MSWNTGGRMSAEPGEVQWGIAVLDDHNNVASVTYCREFKADRNRTEHTEETARADRETWVGPGGGWHDRPDRIVVVSRTITDWTVQ